MNLTRHVGTLITRVLAPALVGALVIAAMAATAEAQPPTFSDLAEEAGPAVVNISTVRVVQGHQMGNMGQLPEGPMGEFFKKFFGGPDNQPREQMSLGSGFVLTKDGYIVTNNHVVAKAEEIKVNLQGHDEAYDAKVVGRDPEMDLALIKIDVGKGLPTLEFDASGDIEVGSWVVAIGNPFGLSHTVTAGIISAKGRVIGAGPFDDFIQTDASINPGNSGGPLLNMDGEVVGINTAIVAAGQGIGFAIPSDAAADIIQELRTTGRVSRGWLGVSIQNLDKNMAKALNLDKARGAVIAKVMHGEPADKAGLEQGDVVVAVDGEKIENANELLRDIADHKPGQTVKLEVWRDGDKRSVRVKLGERAQPRVASHGRKQQEEGGRLGVSVRPVSEREARALQMDKARGLIVSQVQAGSPAAEAGVTPGDVILEANQQAMNNVDALRRIIRESEDKGVVLLLIYHRGQTLFKTVELPAK